MSMRPSERIRFSRVYICSWCICHDISHKMIEISLNRHRSFLVPQNTDKFRHDEILFPVFVLIHHIQSLLDCQTWLAFFPYLIRFYGISHLSGAWFFILSSKISLWKLSFGQSFLSISYLWFLHVIFISKCYLFGIFIVW